MDVTKHKHTEERRAMNGFRARLRTLLALALLALAALPAGALADVTVVRASTGKVIPNLQRAMDRSPIDTPAITVKVRNGCHGYGGVFSYEHPFTVCVQPEFEKQYPDTFAHELGHLIDNYLANGGTTASDADFALSDALHSEFMRDMHLGARVRYSWDWTFNVCGGKGGAVFFDCEASASEWFAESFSWCSTTPRREWPTVDLETANYGWHPTHKTFVKWCTFLQRDMATV